MTSTANGQQLRFRPIGRGATVEYAVETRGGKGQRWCYRGRVMRCGGGYYAGDGVAQWAALGTDADAWTSYRRTRGEAVADMLAGVTFKTYASV